MTMTFSSKHWTKGKLQDLVFFQRGYDITKAQQIEGSVPVISSSGVTSHHNEPKATGPGIVIGRKGTLGSVHYSEGDYWPHDTTLWSKDLLGNNPRFVYFYLHTINFKRFDVGNSNPTLNRNHIHNLPTLIPPLDTQERIADTLSAYDDLIENNRQRIAALEVASRQLYREWFIRLRFPGHEHTRISNSTPEGWTRKSIGAHFTTVLGGTPSRAKPEYWDDGTVPWINSGKANELRILQASEFITEIGLKNSAAKMMPKGTTVIAITGATLGQVSMLEIDCAANQSVVGITDDSRTNTEWLYLTMKERIPELVARATGGAQVHINKDIVNAFEIVVPSKNISDIFRDSVTSMFRQISNLSLQNIKLRTARDLLLPKLMSGEITV